MKVHTSGFKDAIKSLGREISAKITYTLNNEEIELGNTQLNSISIHYEGGLLKSVMKQLDLDSNVDIPLGTQIKAEFGLKVGNGYEYLNYGNYIVYSSEKQEDLGSYKIIAYDKILYSMKDYETILVESEGEYVPLQYPITIREYMIALCNNLGLVFANSNDMFANYDKEIPNELYLDDAGNNLGYTFRDVLDEIAQVTASTICINDNDEIELRYPQLIGDTTEVSGTSLYIPDAKKDGILYEGVNNITQVNNDLPFVMELEYLKQSDFETINEEYLKDVNVNFGEKYGPINSIVLSRSADSDKVYLRDEDSVSRDGLCELVIADNQIMNDNNRSDYLPDILEVLDGLEYYINDYTSTGICYLELCDIYGVSIDGNVYNCLMLNDEINIEQGIEERIHTDMPEETETDYSKADKTDRKIRKAYIMVDKQKGEIISQVEDVDKEYQTLNKRLYGDENEEGDIQRLGTQITQKVDSVTFDVYKTMMDDLETNGAKKVQTTSVIINNEGLSVSKPNESKISTTMTNSEFRVQDNAGTKLIYMGYDESAGASKAEMDNLTVHTYFTSGMHRVEKYTDENTGKDRTGWFYIGGV